LQSVNSNLVEIKDKHRFIWHIESKKIKVHLKVNNNLEINL